MKGFIDWRKGDKFKTEESDLSRGNLFATGLVAGGAITGVVVAVLNVFFSNGMDAINSEHRLTSVLGDSGYFLMGTLFFIAMLLWLYRIARKD